MTTTAPYKSAYQRVKEAEKEKPANGNGNDAFLRLGANESVRIRFLYNVENPDHKNEMLAFVMHDFYTPELKYTKAVCTRDSFVNGGACYWCQVAEKETKAANAMKNKLASKEAWKEGAKKKARDICVMPIAVYSEPTEDNPKPKPELMLLDLKKSIETTLFETFENGIELESGTVHDVTAAEFTYSRIDKEGEKTKYSLTVRSLKRMSFTPPSLEKVLGMVLDSRPPRELNATSAAVEDTALGEDDEHPF